MSHETRSRDYNAKARHFAVLIAYARGEISEGMALHMLSIDRLSLREHVEDAIAVAKELEQRYREERTTVADDFAREAEGFGEWLHAANHGGD